MKRTLHRIITLFGHLLCGIIDWLPRPIQRCFAQGYMKLCKAFPRATILYKPLQPVLDVPFIITLHHFRYEGNFNSYIDHMLYLNEQYEPEIFALMDHLTATLKPTTFVDVGANAGLYSMFMSPRVERVLAYEPYPPILQRLVWHIAINDLPNITVQPVGLGKEDAERAFHAPSTANTGKGTFSDDFSLQYGDGEDDLKLHICHADTELTQHAIMSPCIMKIDVEGLEREVLEGLRLTLKRMKPVIIVEISPHLDNNFPTQSSMAALFPNDYQFYTIHRTKTGYQLQQSEDWRTATQHNILAIPNQYIGAL